MFLEVDDEIVVKILINELKTSYEYILIVDECETRDWELINAYEKMLRQYLPAYEADEYINEKRNSLEIYGSNRI